MFGNRKGKFSISSTFEKKKSWIIFLIFKISNNLKFTISGNILCFHSEIKLYLFLQKYLEFIWGKKYISTCDDNGILNLDSSTSKSWAKGSRNFTDHIVGRNICRPLDRTRKICHQMIYRSLGASYLSVQLILMEFILFF